MVYNILMVVGGSVGTNLIAEWIIEIPIIEFTYNGILKIPVLQGCISKKIAVIEEWNFL